MRNITVVNNPLDPDTFFNIVISRIRIADSMVLPRPHNINLNNLKKLHKEVGKSDKAGVAFLTSGSVGTSKIVIRDYDSIYKESNDVARKLNLNINDNILITSPVTHSYGFGMLMAAKLVGAKVFTANSPNIYTRLKEIKNILASEKIDIMTGVPFIFKMLLKSKPERVAIRNFVGGETVPLPLIKNWENEFNNSHLLQEYGLSEVGIVSFGSIHDIPTSIGTPIPNTKIIIENGELIVKRDSAPTKYLKGNSEETFTNFGIKTGDLGYERNGLFYLTGRKKSLIIVAGLNVVPEEVENVIRYYSKVDEVVVKGENHDLRGEIPVAYITPKLSNNKIKVLKDWLGDKLESYKIPQKFITMNEFPRTSSGKVDRNGL